MSPITRAELVARLAEVSRLSYVRQKHRDHGVPLETLTLEVTDHDRERAEDAVAELERLGLYPGGEKTPAGAADREPAEDTVPTAAEPERQAITDIWGRPLAHRRRRGT